MRYSSPYKVGHSNIEQDINLISLYQIKVNYTYKNKVNHINIVTDKAQRPDGYKFSIGDVAKSTVKAVKSDFSDKNRSLIYINGLR